jgi:hypothetical protein
MPRSGHGSGTVRQRRKGNPVTALAPGQPEVSTEHRRRFGRRARRLVVVAVLAIAATAWIWVGTHPRVVPGSFSGGGDDFRIASDGIADTRYVLKGDEGRFLTSIRNDGRVPFTLLGIDTARAGPFMTLGGFQPDPFGPGKGIGDMTLPTRRQVTLGSGEEAGVVLGFAVGRCVYMQAGSSSDTNAVHLRVRQAGITTTQSLPLDLPLTVLGTSTPENYPAECPPLE